MRRRIVLGAVAAATGSLLLGACGIFAGASRARSDAVATRLRSWLESDPRVADVASVDGQNYEGDVRAIADVTLVSSVTADMIADFQTALYAASRDDHWIVSVAGTITFSFDSQDKDRPVLQGTSQVWRKLRDDQSVTSARIVTGWGGLGVEARVSDDPVTHGLAYAVSDWASGLAAGYTVLRDETPRRLKYEFGTVDAADVAALGRLAVAYQGPLRLTMVGTTTGQIEISTSGDAKAVQTLVSSLDLPSSFRVTITATTPATSPTASTT